MTASEYTAYATHVKEARLRRAKRAPPSGCELGAHLPLTDTSAEPILWTEVIRSLTLGKSTRKPYPAKKERTNHRMEMNDAANSERCAHDREAQGLQDIHQPVGRRGPGAGANRYGPRGDGGERDPEGHRDG